MRETDPGVHTFILLESGAAAAPGRGLGGPSGGSFDHPHGIGGLDYVSSGPQPPRDPEDWELRGEDGQEEEW